MKPYFKLKIGLVLCLSILLSSCDLELQDNFDFVPEVDKTDPFDDITAWEFIQTRTALISEVNPNFDPEEDEDGPSNEELHFMILAIQKVGFEDLYNQTETTDRTYLLLNNNAFRGNDGIIDLVVQRTDEEIEQDEENAENDIRLTPEQLIDRIDTPEEIELMKTILRYHIVTSYIDQVPTLFEKETPYIYQTLIPGDDGLIAFERDSRWRIFINNPGSPLPATATSQRQIVRRHNYVFSNGIGHFLNAPVRNQPYVIE
jgi:hypothetical protein